MTGNLFYNKFFSPQWIQEHGYLLNIELITPEELEKPDGERMKMIFNPDEIVRGSVKLSQSLCSEDYFLWGGCNASSLSFELTTEKFGGMEPAGLARLVLYPILDSGVDKDGRIILFTGYIEDAKPHKKIPSAWEVNAYDVLYKYRNDSISDWLQSLIERHKKAGIHTTWADVFRGVDNMIQLVGHGTEIREWMNTLYFPDNKNVSNLKCVSLLRELAFFSQAFGMIAGDGSLDFVAVQDSITGKDCYEIREFDPKELTFNAGHVWQPQFFTSNPRTNIFFSDDAQTAEERAYNNIYTITNSEFLGDREWIEQMYECDEYGIPNKFYTPTNMPPGLYNTDRLCLKNGETYRQQEYKIKTLCDPTIPMGSIIRILESGKELVRSYIMEREIVFESSQTIWCEMSAKNSPYNTESSIGEREALQAKEIANSALTKIPTIKSAAGLNRLKAIVSMTKAEYTALKDKRGDTIYYVY